MRKPKFKSRYKKKKCLGRKARLEELKQRRGKKK